MTNLKAHKARGKISFYTLYFLAGMSFIFLAIYHFFRDNPNNPQIPFSTTVGLLFINFAILMRRGILQPKGKGKKLIKAFRVIIIAVVIYAVLTICFDFCKTENFSPMLMLIIQIVFPVGISILFAFEVDSIGENTKSVPINSHGTAKKRHRRK